MPLADNGAHPLLNRRQVFRRQRAGQVKVVVKAVLDGRADGDLGLREALQDGLSHDVRRRVTDTVQFGILVALHGAPRL